MQRGQYDFNRKPMITRDVMFFVITKSLLRESLYIMFAADLSTEGQTMYRSLLTGNVNISCSKLQMILLAQHFTMELL